MLNDNKAKYEAPQTTVWVLETACAMLADSTKDGGGILPSNPNEDDFDFELPVPIPEIA